MPVPSPVRPLAAALALACAAGPAGAADPPPRNNRVTPFTIERGPSLPPNPRGKVQVDALAVPEPPPPPAPPVQPLPAAQLFGRWTERDVAYCDREQYVIEWAPEWSRVLVDGRAIEIRPVRYAEEPGSLKVERLEAGAVAGWWRLVAVADGQVRWTENAERKGAAVELVAKPEKLLVRCPADAEPPPGFLARVRRVWASLLDSLNPWSAPPPAEAKRPAS